MFKSLKKILKQIIPPPTATFQREINRIDDTICSQNNQLKELVLRLQYQLQDLNQGNQIVLKQQIAMLNEISLIQENKLNQISEENKRLSDALERNKDKINQTMRIAEEATWAAIFNNTIGQSNWLQNKTFSPGRWAVGYPALYVIYRVLNEISPKRILEIGLGQSTRMIGQYAAAHTGVKHLVVEHDPEWISFFSNDFSLSNQTKIVQLSRKMVKHKESDAVRVFSDFKKRCRESSLTLFLSMPRGRVIWNIMHVLTLWE